MNLIIISGSASATGGAEKIALNSAARLAARGHKVRVAAARGPVSEEWANLDNLEVLVANPDPVPERPSFPQRVGMVWPQGMSDFFGRVFRDATEETVIHFHSGYFEFAIPGFREIVRSGLPIVYTHHDYAWACPLTGLYDYRQETQCELKGGTVKCLATDCVGSHREKVIRFARHLGAHQTSGMRDSVRHHLFVSDYAREAIRPYLRSDSPNSVLLNPVDFAKSPRNVRVEDSSLLFVGRLTSEKDPTSFAVAAREAKMSAKIVGDGPLREDLEQAGFGDDLVGWISSNEVGERLKGSRALVMTSRTPETAGMVVQEAFSVGTPVIVPGDTASAEFVEDGVTGFIYDRNQPNGLLEAMQRFQDLETVNRMGEAAYQRFWTDPPTWDRHITELESIYAGVLGLDTSSTQNANPEPMRHIG